jgi:hypothetical protein
MRVRTLLLCLSNNSCWLGLLSKRWVQLLLLVLPPPGAVLLLLLLALVLVLC